MPVTIVDRDPYGFAALGGRIKSALYQGDHETADRLRRESALLRARVHLAEALASVQPLTDDEAAQFIEVVDDAVEPAA